MILAKSMVEPIRSRIGSPKCEYCDHTEWLLPRWESYLINYPYPAYKVYSRKYCLNCEARQIDLTAIVEAPIDPQEVSKTLLAEARSKFDKSDAQVEEYLERMAIDALSLGRGSPILSPGTILRQQHVGDWLWNFAAEKIKDMRVRSAMNQAYAAIECSDIVVEQVVMSIADYNTFRKFITREAYDSHCQREVLTTGCEGMLWGANIFVSDKTDKTTVMGAMIE